jgi:hypothetical protein
MKNEPDPTPEELQKLLAWLDAAGKDYVTTHARLTRIYFRDCVDGEALADIVMNRVAVRIDELVKKYEDPFKCLVGFARNVLRELKPAAKPLDDVNPTRKFLSVDPVEKNELELQKRELEDECLSTCLVELNEADRRLFWGYFQDDKLAKVGRKKLAEELLLTANALRIKAHRLRKRMFECMQACLGENAER